MTKLSTKLAYTRCNSAAALRSGPLFSRLPSCSLRKWTRSKFWLSCATFTLFCFGSATVSAGKKDTLAAKFENDFLIGTAISTQQVTSPDARVQALINREFNAITPENAMKWESLNRSPGDYDFSVADKIMKDAAANGHKVIGHTLVWHNQLPAYLFLDDKQDVISKDALLTRLKHHIDKVAGRYKGQIYAWDVVNEALNDDGSLRQSPWLDILGEDYLIKSFQWARKADPQAELYYNDYNLFKPAKRDGAIRMIKSLQAEGVRVDGIGLQGHYGMDYPSMHQLEQAIKAFSNLGIKVMITELDITMLPSPSEAEQGADITQNFTLQAQLNPYAKGLPKKQQKLLAKRYKDFFSLFLKYRDSIDRVTLWGVNDSQSWRNYWPVHGRSDYPLLFDRNNKPKRAYKALMKLDN